MKLFNVKKDKMSSLKFNFDNIEEIRKALPIINTQEVNKNVPIINDPNIDEDKSEKILFKNAFDDSYSDISVEEFNGELSPVNNMFLKRKKSSRRMMLNPNKIIFNRPNAELSTSIYNLSFYESNPLNKSSDSFVIPNNESIIMKEEIKLITCDVPLKDSDGNDVKDTNGNIVTVQVKGIQPVRGSVNSACKSLFSPVDCVIHSGKRILIKTNVAIAWDRSDYYMQIFPNSRSAYNNLIHAVKSIVNYDYRQNIGVILHNYSNKDLVIKAGDCIAEYNYVKIIKEESKLVDEFTIPL